MPRYQADTEPWGICQPRPACADVTLVPVPLSPLHLEGSLYHGPFPANVTEDSLWPFATVGKGPWEKEPVSGAVLLPTAWVISKPFRLWAPASSLGVGGRFP